MLDDNRCVSQTWYDLVNLLYKRKDLKPCEAEFGNFGILLVIPVLLTIVKFAYRFVEDALVWTVSCLET